MQEKKKKGLSLIAKKNLPILILCILFSIGASCDSGAGSCNTGVGPQKAPLND